MNFLKTHPESELVRYIGGELSAEESRAVEEHLATCADCSDEVAFIRELDVGLAALPKDVLLPPGLHLDSTTLVAYEAGEMDEETARRLRVHVFRCDQCAEKFYALRRARPKTIDLVLRVARGIVECLRVPEGLTPEPVPLAVATRGAERVFLAPFRITETLVDADGMESAVTLQVEEAIKPERVRVVLECEPLPEKWRVSLSDGEGYQLASVRLARAQVETADALAWGFYAVEISKDEDLLGRFSFTIEPFHLTEALDSALENLDARDYARARYSAGCRPAASRQPRGLGPALPCAVACRERRRGSATAPEGGASQ